MVAVPSGDARALAAALPNANAIAHCIAGAAAQIQRNAATLYGLLATSNARPRVVHLSSMTVYGSATGAVDESCEPRADLGPYSQAHRAAEKVSAAAGAVILRPAAEYGPTCGAWSGRIARLLKARRLGDLGEFGDGWCNLVFIDDLASVFRWALREPGIEGKIFNVADPQKITWNDYFTRYAIALGATPVRRIGPRRLKWETRLAAPPLWAAGLLANTARLRFLPIPPPIPPSMLRLCGQAIDLSPALLDGIMRPTWTPLDKGLRQAAEAYG